MEGIAMSPEFALVQVLETVPGLRGKTNALQPKKQKTESPAQTTPALIIASPIITLDLQTNITPAVIHPIKLPAIEAKTAHREPITDHSTT